LVTVERWRNQEDAESDMRRFGVLARSLLMSRPEQKCAPVSSCLPQRTTCKSEMESDVRFRLGIGVAEMGANWYGPRLSMLSSHQLSLVWD
jgi:hypothetical protein